MKYPGLIAGLAQLCKQAGVGPSYPKVRPAETPAQAKRAVPKVNNFSTGCVLQQAAPQNRPPLVTTPPQQTGTAGRLPQIGTIE